MDLPGEVKGFKLANQEKVDRALNGAVDAHGDRSGGIAQEDGTFDEDALLAEYDRLGGLITRNGDKVKTGSFYDFRNRKPRQKAEIVFVYRVNGAEVEVADGEQLPGEVKAVKTLEESKGKMAKAAKKK